MIPRTLPAIVVDVLHRTEEIERRIENRTRTGLVYQVDAKKGLARVQIDTDPDTGQPVLTAWISWKEPAMGFIKTHFPPSVGEQVKVVSESGDMTDAVIDTSLPTDQNKRPHDKEKEAMIKIGEKTSLLMTEGRVTLTTPHKRVESGKIEFQKSGGGGAGSGGRDGVPMA